MCISIRYYWPLRFISPSLYMKHTTSTWVHVCIFARIPGWISVLFLTGHRLVPIDATPTLTNWYSDRRSNKSKNEESNQSVGLPPNRPTDGKFLSVGRSVGQSEIQKKGKCWKQGLAGSEIEKKDHRLIGRSVDWRSGRRWHKKMKPSVGRRIRKGEFIMRRGKSER